MKPTRTYTRDGVTVEWRPELCIHCQECINGLPDVFNLDARPWVNMQGADVPRIVQQVKLCPTGALSITSED